jgi:hypothetical protein
MKYLGMLLLSFISLVSPVSANCEWVLWGRVFIPGVTHTPLESFDNLKSCKTEMNKRAVESSKNKDVAAFRCLPDTVDPRSPKGE